MMMFWLLALVHKGHAISDIPGVHFKVIKVAMYLF